jgi:hypothetical protein
MKVKKTFRQSGLHELEKRGVSRETSPLLVVLQPTRQPYAIECQLYSIDLNVFKGLQENSVRLATNANF